MALETVLNPLSRRGMLPASDNYVIHDLRRISDIGYAVFANTAIAALADESRHISCLLVHDSRSFPRL